MLKFLRLFFLHAVVFSFTDLAAAQSADSTGLNMETVYNRPAFHSSGNHTAIGGYSEMKAEKFFADGQPEPMEFNLQRISFFLRTKVSDKIRFLIEGEFINGGKQINLNCSAVDFRFCSLFNLRGGVIINPIGIFNQVHDGPLYEFTDRPFSSTEILPSTFSSAGFGFYGLKKINNWAIGYEAYITNGFSYAIIDNESRHTLLSASVENGMLPMKETNGQMMMNGKFSVRQKNAGELGLSWRGGCIQYFSNSGITT